MKPLNPVFADAGTTIFTVMSALANQHGAVNLGQGFPDVDGPMELRQRAATALIEGPNQYPPMMGVEVLRQALSAHAKRLNTWDHMLFPKPFARGAIVIPDPIPTSKDMDSEELRQRVEHALKEATARADQLAGLDPDVKPASPRPAPALQPAKSAETTEPAMEHGGS
jgi:hypothetical protein